MSEASPPYDGKPCPGCHEAVRNLYAVAGNLVLGGGDTSISDLRRAVELVRPLIDAHFADKTHAYASTRDWSDTDPIEAGQ